MTTVSPRPRGRRLWLLLSAVLLVAAAGAAYLFWWRDRGESTLVAAVPSYQDVTVGTYRSTIPAPGTLRAARTAELRNENAGTVAEIATLGTRVEAGDVVARMSTVDLERSLREAELALQKAERSLAATITDQDSQARSLQHQVADAETALAQAQRDLTQASEQLDLTRRLAEVGSVSARELSQAELDASHAQAGLQLAQRDLADVRLSASQQVATHARDQADARSSLEQAQLNLTLAEEALAAAEIRAPIAGVVDSVSVQAGSHVSANSALLSLADDRRLELVAQVDESEVGQLSLGMSAEVTVTAASNRPLPATLAIIAPSATTSQNIPVFEIVLSLENPGLAFRPGMTAEAEVIVREEAGTVSVPLTALQRDPQRPGSVSLMVRQDADAELVALPVELVATAGSTVVVRSEQLQNGMQVQLPAGTNAVVGLRAAAGGQGAAGGLFGIGGGAGGGVLIPVTPGMTLPAGGGGGFPGGVVFPGGGQ